MATITSLKTRFNTWLRDADDTTFTSAEKDELLLAAVNDPYVFTITRDSSLTTVINQSSYTLPTGLYGLTDLYIDQNQDGFPFRIPHDWYDEIGGVIYFDHFPRNLPASKPMICVGKLKLTTTDTIPTYLEEYILHLAMVNAFELLKSSLTTRFLRNDMTMSELIASIHTHQIAALTARATLPNRREIEV